MTMKKIGRRLPVGALLAVVVAAVSLAAMPLARAADPAQERIDGFKASKRATAEIKDAIDRGDMATVAQQARLLAVFAEKIPDLYPPHAKGGFLSAAKDDIWKSFPDFVRKAEAFQGSSRQLADLAASKNTDVAAVSQRLRQVTDSCTACHRVYKRGR